MNVLVFISLATCLSLGSCHKVRRLLSRANEADGTEIPGGRELRPALSDPARARDWIARVDAKRDESLKVEGTAFHVGPGQKYQSIGAVPWFRLTAGDVVFIHYRKQPYREKFLISSRGTPSRWIRVIGVLGPGGELPVISGDQATTSPNMKHFWKDATGDNAIQGTGVVQVAFREGGTALPGYIEIANLQVQDGQPDYQFTAENGTRAHYNGFTACIYARSAQHLVVRHNVLTNCAQGFYDWTGDGSSDSYWAGVAKDVVLRDNAFYNNGTVKSWTEHQIYTESDGVLIEHNWFGRQRAGALGSQIKDRSVGTIIRYNYIEQALAGWDLDLVEPEESWPSLHTKPAYGQTFVYGNVIVNKTNRSPNFVHWNEDHYGGRGRASVPGGKLFFYDNTVVTVADRSDMRAFAVFNTHMGGYDCPQKPLPGVIDVRNNVFAVLPRTPGAAIPELRLSYCHMETIVLGTNWISPGWSGNAKLIGNVVSPNANTPGFVSVRRDDYRLVSGASAAAALTGKLAPEVTSNSLDLDLTPKLDAIPLQGQPATGGAP